MFKTNSHIRNLKWYNSLCARERDSYLNINAPRCRELLEVTHAMVGVIMVAETDTHWSRFQSPMAPNVTDGRSKFQTLRTFA